jgi:hypothetical protein
MAYYARGGQYPFFTVLRRSIAARRLARRRRAAARPALRRRRHQRAAALSTAYQWHIKWRWLGLGTRFCFRATPSRTPGAAEITMRI